MKKSIPLFSFLFLCLALAAQIKTFHSFKALTIVDKNTLNLADFKGKKVLVVNLASYCGFTCQYSELVTLDSLYGGPTFAILGFPCNDFGAQEPKDDATILAFAKDFRVRFQMMSKIAIKEPNGTDLYKWLQNKSQNGVANAPVTWNFNKFCIDEAGRWVKHYPEEITPLNAAIVNWIKSPSTVNITNENKVPEISLINNPSFEKITLKIISNNPSDLTIQLFDLQGKQVAQLFSGKINGTQLVSYLPENINSGVYFIRAQSEGMDKTMKVCYTK